MNDKGAVAMHKERRKRMKGALRLLPLVVLLFLPFMLQCQKQTGGKAEIIQIKGSDTMVNVAQAWAEAYKAVEPAVEIEVS
ncbi:MAG: hypothetical protein JXA71_06125, partial [Chitinispirillaceae bacterium]|nr:hypothetical protein [Chitinispirillaceae bacterium]